MLVAVGGRIGSNRTVGEGREASAELHWGHPDRAAASADRHPPFLNDIRPLVTLLLASSYSGLLVVLLFVWLTNAAADHTSRYIQDLRLNLRPKLRPVWGRELLPLRQELMHSSDSLSLGLRPFHRSGNHQDQLDRPTRQARPISLPSDGFLHDIDTS